MTSKREAGQEEPANAFTSFYQIERPRLLSALVFLTKDAGLAEEFCQEAFSRVWAKWGRVSRVDDPAGYLFRVGLNVFRDAWRDQRRLELPMPTMRDPMQEVEGRNTLEKALLQLPVRQRTALVVTEFLGYDSKAAARIMGVRPGTVRALKASARESLSSLLGDGGRDDE